jgi:hypothetical protein
VVEFLVNNVGPLAISFAAQAVRGLPVSSPEPAPDAHQPDGCPACQLHDEVALAKALVEAMIVSADVQGRVPRETAGTVMLVEQHLRIAEDRLVPVAAARPDLAGRTQVLGTRLADARTSLPPRETVDVNSARTMQRALDACWQETVVIARLYWTAPPPAALDEVRAVLLELPAPDRERFIASLRA